MALGYKTGASVMMQLGTFQFSITSVAYEEFQRTTAWRWVEVENLGDVSDLQNMGPQNETVTLPYTLYPEWRGGWSQIDTLRALAAMGQPQAMVNGEGVSLGRWVILSVSETGTVFADQGRARKITGTIELKRYRDAEASTVSADGESNIADTTISTGTATGLAAQAQSLASTVSTACASVAGTLSEVSAAVQTAVAPYTAVAKDVLGSVLRATEAVSTLQDTANRVLAQVGISPIDVVAAAGVESIYQDAAGMIVAADSASTLLQATSTRLNAISGVTKSAQNAMTAAVAASNQTSLLMHNTANQADTLRS